MNYRARLTHGNVEITVLALRYTRKCCKCTFMCQMCSDIQITMELLQNVHIQSNLNHHLIALSNLSYKSLTDSSDFMSMFQHFVMFACWSPVAYGAQVEHSWVLISHDGLFLPLILILTLCKQGWFTMMKLEAGRNSSFVRIMLIWPFVRDVAYNW